jgi:S1-C subfamily serine protease
MNQRLFKLAGVLPILIAVGGLVAGVVIVFATSGDDSGSPNAAGNASATATPGPSQSAAPSQPWLGISGKTAAGGTGVEITDVVAGGPADDADLRTGDVILSIDGKDVNDVQALADEVSSHKVFDQVSLRVLAVGSTSSSVVIKVLDVTLEARPATPSPIPQISPAPGAPYLGISGGPASNGKGVAINSVADGSPADKAGLKAGDLILKADGKAVNDIPALAAIVTGHDVGDQMTLTIVKGGVANPDGDQSQVTVTLEPKPADNASPTPAPLPTAWLGIAGETGANGGVDITSVVADGPADKAGLKAGDHIAGIDGETVESFDVLAGIIAVHSPGDKVTLSVIKDGVAHPNNAKSDVDVTLGKRLASGPSFGEQLPLLPDIESLLPDLQSIIGGQFQYKDKNGDTVTVSVDVGTVESVTSSQIKIKRADDSEKTFTVNSDSDVPSNLSNGDEVVVVSKNGVVLRAFGGLADLLPGGGFSLPNCTYDSSGLHCDFGDGNGQSIPIPSRPAFGSGASGA